jgi:stress-induced-phosphoprotein 1
MAGFVKMFGEEGVRLISKDPTLSPFLSDPIFSAMIEDIADNPGNIVKYQNDPRLQPALMTILPMMLSTGPDRAPPAPNVPPPATNSDAESEKKLGNECFQRKDFEGALKHYDRALEIDGGQMVYHSNRATALTKLGRFEEGMDAALKAVEVGQAASAPNDQLAKAYAKVATAALGCKKEGGALTALHESLYLNEDAAVRKSYEALKKKLGNSGQ